MSKTTTLTITERIDQAAKVLAEFGENKIIYDNFVITVEKLIEPEKMTDEDWLYWSA